MIVFTSMSISSVLKAAVNVALDFTEGITIWRCSVASLSNLLKQNQTLLCQWNLLWFFGCFLSIGLWQPLKDQNTSPVTFPHSPSLSKQVHHWNVSVGHINACPGHPVFVGMAVCYSYPNACLHIVLRNEHLSLEDVFALTVFQRYSCFCRVITWLQKKH